MAMMRCNFDVHSIRSSSHCHYSWVPSPWDKMESMACFPRIMLVSEGIRIVATMGTNHHIRFILNLSIPSGRFNGVQPHSIRSFRHGPRVRFAVPILDQTRWIFYWHLVTLCDFRRQQSNSRWNRITGASECNVKVMGASATGWMVHEKLRPRVDFALSLLTFFFFPASWQANRCTERGFPTPVLHVEVMGLNLSSIKQNKLSLALSSVRARVSLSCSLSLTHKSIFNLRNRRVSLSSLVSGSLSLTQ
jgi:hypothetical protein